MLDIKLDALSLVVPSKTLNEVIYNRLGNDMLLLLPQYINLYLLSSVVGRTCFDTENFIKFTLSDFLRKQDVLISDEAIRPSVSQVYQPLHYSIHCSH